MISACGDLRRKRRKIFALDRRVKKRRMEIFFSAKEKKNGEGEEEEEWRRKISCRWTDGWMDIEGSIRCPRGPKK